MRQAAGDPKLLWKMAQWGKDHSHLPLRTPTVPSLRSATHMDGLAVSFEDKVESFHARFFPSPAETDLSDAHGPYPSEVEAVEPVTTEEVVAVIAYLPTGKASGASGVPNEYWKL